MPEDFNITLLEKCIIRFAQQINKLEQIMFDFMQDAKRFYKDQREMHYEILKIVNDLRELKNEV